MGFMKSYKHLDNLCRDMNGVGVTGYIEDMDKSVNGPYHVPGWQSDYRTLKHYRYIRNRIAHDDDADEDNICCVEDELWLENFYQRIMEQNDPLALYRKSVRKPCVSPKPLVPERPRQTQNVSRNSDTWREPHENKFLTRIYYSATVILVAVVVLLIFFVFFFA